MLVAQLAEHAGVGGEAGLAAALLGQTELVEEDGGELLGRADRELVAGELVDLRLELVDLLVHPGADLGEALGVELEADALHLRERFDQRHLDLVEQLLDAELGQPLALALGELVREPGVDRWVAGRLALLGGERELAFLGAGGRRGEAGVGGELVEVVGAPGGIDQVGGDHGVVLEVEPVRAARRPCRLSGPWPPSALMSWAISGRSARSAASAARSEASPATTLAPSLAAQRPAPHRQ